jgi:endonuclease YncB( thermonuclease family)
VDLVVGYLMDFARWMMILVLSTLYPEVYSPWVGKAVEIVRADEIRVQRDGQTYSVRLYGIDAPIGWKGESREPPKLHDENSREETVRNRETSIAIPSPQDYGNTAKDYVSRRALGKPVLVQPLPGSIKGPWYKPKIQPYDRFNRMQAFVWIYGETGSSLNEELLKTGQAWWYSPFVPFERGFKYLEDGARRERLGLWAQTNPIPPWQWQGTKIVETNPVQRRGTLVLWVAGLAATGGMFGIIWGLLTALVRRTAARKRRQHHSLEGERGAVSS